MTLVKMQNNQPVPQREFDFPADETVMKPMAVFRQG